MDITEAAQLLGVPDHEVTDVVDAAEGTVITTFDGARYVDVAADKPDGDGKTGLMYLEKPDPDREYTFRVYTPHTAEEADEIEQTSPRSKRAKKTAPAAADEAPAEPVESSGFQPAPEQPAE